jgi:probable addiction module antidote protein
MSHWISKCRGDAVPSRKSFDPTKYRDDPAAIAEYLDHALTRDDLSDFVRAVGAMMRAQNVVALSEETGLRRENLYRMFAGDRDPRLGNTMKVLASLGVQFAIKPRSSPRPKKPRPKLGRPKSEASL